MKPLPEKNESLWRLVVSPTIWAAHFMLSYITAAIWCAKFAPANGSLAPVRWAIGAYTIIALIGIVINGVDGFRRHRYTAGQQPHETDTPEDRHRFMGFATALLAGLSGIATLYAAMVVLIVRDCR